MNLKKEKEIQIGFLWRNANELQQEAKKTTTRIRMVIKKGKAKIKRQQNIMN